MKRNLLLLTCSIFIYTISFSQNITHIDYGEQGLVIDLNDAYAMDIDFDGSTDFFINSWSNELGFTPIFGLGCFASEDYTANTAWGSSVLQIFEEGETLRIDGVNMYDYLDDDRGSNYKSGEGTAEGWFNGQPNYIGFAVFNQFSEVTNGWMKVKVDTESEQLIILEYAYHDYAVIGEGEITVGDRGFVNVDNLDGILSDIVVAPNPATDIINVSYDYQGQENIQVAIFDNLGKEITRTNGNLQSNLVFNASNWTNGIYYVNFNTDKGVHTERIMISH